MRHPAWNPSELFSRRIQNLPLFFLEISHPYRDRKTESTTITHYAPCRAEMMALARIVRSYGKDLRVCDIGCGNGFLGSLLARERLNVFGIDDRSYKQPQIQRFFDKDCYSVIETSLADLDVPFDVAFCSWMTPGLNLTPAIVAQNPLMIIHIFSHDKQSNGSLTTGEPAAYDCPENYEFLIGWWTEVPEDYFLPLNECIEGVKLDPNLRKTRKVLVFIRRDLRKQRPSSPLGFLRAYNWDKERRLINELRRIMGLPESEVRAVLSDP